MYGASRFTYGKLVGAIKKAGGACRKSYLSWLQEDAFLIPNMGYGVEVKCREAGLVFAYV